MKLELNTEISFVNLTTSKTYVISLHKKGIEYMVVRKWTIPNVEELGISADLFKTFENAIVFANGHISTREKNGYKFLMERKNIEMPKVEIKQKIEKILPIKKEYDSDPRHANAKPPMTGRDIEEELKKRQANLNTLHNLIKY